MSIWEVPLTYPRTYTITQTLSYNIFPLLFDLFPHFMGYLSCLHLWRHVLDNNVEKQSIQLLCLTYSWVIVLHCLMSKVLNSSDLPIFAGVYHFIQNRTSILTSYFILTRYRNQSHHVAIILQFTFILVQFLDTIMSYGLKVIRK